MTTKKFWCHYIGSDGNTPKRRSIELKNLSDLIPIIGDNTNCPTPIWYEEFDKHVETYVQLNDKVAVSTLIDGVIYKSVVEFMLKTDADFDAECEESIERIMAAKSPYFTTEKKAASCERERKNCEERKKRRDSMLEKLMQYKDYTTMLINGAWIANATIRGYEEVLSPYLPVLQELRRQKMEERERREQERREENRRRAEEEARKKAESEAKEQERLTHEAEKFKQGESISGSDVVDLCRRHGIAIHLRTVHNLQQVVADINGKNGSCHYYRQRGKRTPTLDGCHNTARQLYNYLQAQ